LFLDPISLKNSKTEGMKAMQLEKMAEKYRKVF